ncbi:diacylglycerol kinase family protein [Agreia sp. COWG]|uniref:diacylglycerol/lipid kinase family protein n=1 Tax=Agreia sp. COWG TaxID=2773266 RepID=UPI00192663F7|nr:diacylglycerol kinase family protein [Agreia sp. COWG]CAD5994106.1 Diacylglycerol kinase [Agreia sp. COWG]
MPSPKRIVVAINPSASFGSKGATGPRVVDALRSDGHDVTPLTAPDYAALRDATASAVDARGPAPADALVIVGGDGMVSLAVNLLAETGVPFGIIPSGTGNDMARGLGIPLDGVDEAVAHLRAALERPARTIDAGRILHAAGTTWFGCVLSAGFDALVNERANSMSWPRGASRYVLALLRELVTLRARSYELEVDGVARTERASLIAVANNTSLGGGMTVAPDARVDDGLLDLFRVSPLTRLRFLRLFPKVFKGTHTHLDVVEITRVSRVRIEADDVIAYADGERVGPLPVVVEVVPGALRVFA